ncbi:TIR domain-containing protein [Nibribacter ruber]|uniref:TIR domain-containing protein n=1 Tax=Nibribacter ruber TaxID=2698458 RepID=A0A6P1P034_9BACT|nr:toll/interleukin-1 receptor domain-containing protein [Nibribacter ruber]QHL87638.1 TIR domain-containing protein [Nibribacter ruber]
MSVFISYSSKDSEFIERLSVNLVKNRINVWLDKWAMQPGDSLIDKIQQGLTDSSFLLVVLSNNSVESEWCKKELNSGLMRELEEKKVVVIPILLEKCKVPLLLKEKLYADFTEDFDKGFESLLRPLQKLSSEHLGRVKNGENTTDYAINWGLDKISKNFLLEIDVVTWYPKDQKTVLLQIIINGDNKATDRFKKQFLSGFSHLMKDALLLDLMSNKATKDLNILCRNDAIDPHLIRLHDSKNGIEFDIKIRGVLMGVDTGNDTLINLIDILEMITSIDKTKNYAW